MPFILSRLLSRWLLGRGWTFPVAVVVCVFVTSWPLMLLAEPEGSELVLPGNYWWYFVVTATTVGYGDFSPETTAGHFVGAYVIVGGIVTITTVFTRLASKLELAKGRRMQGLDVVRAEGHTLLIGYTPGRTERLVEQLLDDGATGLVLCANDDTAVHPMPARPVDFVRGEPTAVAVLTRAAVETARTVLVDMRDDNEALAVAVTVNHANRSAHMVVTLRDMAKAELVHYVDPRIKCVQWHTPRMVTEELTSPGIAEVYSELMTTGGASTYSAVLPGSLGRLSTEKCKIALGRAFGATVLAARADDALVVNPSWDGELPAGSTLYYVGPRRLADAEIEAVLSECTP
ncbi:potassium channel family protein [Amycolatopsis keratiniphila]|uniref:potassium channel family protein n=1 Tax=Amycolatopsis keratiniphila TaxID=129921 RepID=UPI00087C84DA|nr:potassium channel family protein [Amycolatopsis keratiniphila]OLZ58127.1 ion transporter [Amycolatopsis keratiniphila subsp. nogabecina]SDU44313.1 voltage-gated potassium channel [Amycolatopsis keratiniphila]